MPLYHTTLVRSYGVTIESEDEQSAARLAEFFVGFADLSSLQDREKFKFEIKEVELLENDSIDTSLIDVQTIM